MKLLRSIRWNGGDTSGRARPVVCFAGAAALASLLTGSTGFTGLTATPEARQSVGTATLAVPGRANANASVAASGSFVVAVWSAFAPDGTTDLYAAISRDSGVTFSAPARVNQTPGDARVNGQQPPRVALIPGAGTDPAIPAIVVLWTTKRGDGTLLVTTRSSDGGKSFGATQVVPGSAAAGNRGWESMASGPDGRVAALWLDHRGMAESQQSTMAAMHHDASGGGHDHGSAVPSDGVAMSQRSQLYFTLLDGTTKARALTRGVCYCCKTSLAIGAKGAIYAAWRHVYPGSIRDIAFSASTDGGKSFSKPARVSEDNWVLDGCPEDGPMMAVDAQEQVHIVWPTLVTDTPDTEPTKAIFYSISRDGRTFAARTRLPTEGLAGHPQLALARDGTLVVAWDELSGGSRRVVVARGSPAASGAMTFARMAVVQPATAVYPALAGASDAVVLAWTSGTPADSVIRVERVGSPGAAASNSR